MRIKLLAAALWGTLLLALPGCTLALPEDGTGEDRLIGLYVTAEHLDLFDIEGYLEDNLNLGFSGGEITGDTAPYEGRMYAQVSEGDGNGWRTYTFPVDGVSCFTVTDPSDGAGHTVTSPGMDGLAAAYGDDSESLAGTVYLNASRGNAAYFNPVYQTADGEVYLTAGQGISTHDQTSATPGGSFSHKLEATSTVTDSEGKTAEKTFSVELTVTFWTPPDRVAITQMRNEGQVLRRDEFAGDALPDTLEKERGAAYFIVEEYRAGQETTRALEPGESEYLWFQAAGDGAFCTSHGIELT